MFIICFTYLLLCFKTYIVHLMATSFTYISLQPLSKIPHCSLGQLLWYRSDFLSNVVFRPSTVIGLCLMTSAAPRGTNYTLRGRLNLDTRYRLVVKLDALEIFRSEHP